MIIKGIIEFTDVNSDMHYMLINIMSPPVFEDEELKFSTPIKKFQPIPIHFSILV